MGTFTFVQITMITMTFYPCFAVQRYLNNLCTHQFEFDWILTPRPYVNRAHWIKSQNTQTSTVSYRCWTKPKNTRFIALQKILLHTYTYFSRFLFRASKATWSMQACDFSGNPREIVVSFNMVHNPWGVPWFSLIALPVHCGYTDIAQSLH